MNKPIETVAEHVMKRLCQYRWPGNIRELQNFIERSVVLSSGTLLRPPFADFEQSAKRATGSFATLEDAERRHIVKALDDTNWVIGGLNGAASRLGLKRTTLLSKMERLGISRS